MKETVRIAEQLERALEGGAWHGPALKELLGDISSREAAAHPIAGAHSICELVLHIAVWDDIVRRRMSGEEIENPPPALDWPAQVNGDSAWRRACERLAEGNAALRQQITAFDEARLNEEVPGQAYSFYRMLAGTVEHALYHAGQIAVLRRTLRP
jgi:uncharacterized damage-inducible protein DinB